MSRCQVASLIKIKKSLQNSNEISSFLFHFSPNFARFSHRSQSAQFLPRFNSRFLTFSLFCYYNNAAIFLKNLTKPQKHSPNSRKSTSFAIFCHFIKFYIFVRKRPTIIQTSKTKFWQKQSKVRQIKKIISRSKNHKKLNFIHFKSAKDQTKTGVATKKRKICLKRPKLLKKAHFQPIIHHLSPRLQQLVSAIQPQC